MYPAAGVSRRQITSPRLVANRCCCVRWTFASVDDLNLHGSASASASYDADFPLAGRIANCHLSVRLSVTNRCYIKTRMWANVQRDGRLAEHRWRPLFNAAKFG